MDVYEALEEMKKGKKVYRRCWQGRGFLFLQPIMRSTGVRDVIWSPTDEDYDSKDWEVMG